MPNPTRRKPQEPKKVHLINEGFVCKNIELSNSKCIGAYKPDDDGQRKPEGR